MTVQSTLKVALAGAGMISRHHLLGWQKLAPTLEVTAICDPDAERAHARAKEFGIRRVYRGMEDLFATEKIDALDIASPRETHAAWIRAAAERGLAILCQKPMTPTLDEANILLSAIDPSVRLMVHENWRFRPWYREARRWIEAGAIGDIQLARMTLISSAMLPDATGERPAFVRQPFMTGEYRLMVAEVLIHHLDVMRYLCGPLRVVAARTARSLTQAKGDTFAAIFMETHDGTPVEVTGTMAAPGFPPRTSDRMEIVGSKASIVFDNWTLKLLGAEQRSETFDADQGYQESFDAVIAHFVAALRSGAPFETSPADNMETLRLVEHAYWAAGQRGPLAPPTESTP